MRNSPRSSSLSTIVCSCRLRRPRREDEGASLVEFAIILPVFALMLFGMIQFGLAFAGWDELRNAVQTSARLAANSDAHPNPECGQPDTGSNLICQVSLSIGAPVDTAPTPLTTFTIPTGYTCTAPLQSCSGPSPGGGYAWLDGYYIFENAQWLQIVNISPNPTTQILDSQAFLQYMVPAWTCTTSSGDCAVITTNVAGQTTGSLGSNGLTINVNIPNNQVDVCAQRQIVSLTALPGLQSLHISTTSSFYLTGTSTTLLGCPANSSGCIYQSANGVSCG